MTKQTFSAQKKLICNSSPSQRVQKQQEQGQQKKGYKTIKNLKMIDLCNDQEKYRNKIKTRSKQIFKKKNQGHLSKKLFKRRIWSNEEQNYLCYLVNLIGIPQWTKISSKFNNQFPHRKRTNKQIRERYHNYLRGGKIELKNQLSKEELLCLFEKILEHGTSWVKILSSFPTRTENIVKNYYSKFSRNSILFINEILTKHQNVLYQKFQLNKSQTLDAEWFYNIYDAKTYYPLKEMKEIFQSDFKMFVQRFILILPFLKASFKRKMIQSKDQKKKLTSFSNIEKMFQLSRAKGAVKRRNNKFTYYSQIVEQFFESTTNQEINKIEEVLNLKKKQTINDELIKQTALLLNLELEAYRKGYDLKLPPFEAIPSFQNQQNLPKYKVYSEPISFYFNPFEKVKDQANYQTNSTNLSYYQIQLKQDEQQNSSMQIQKGNTSETIPQFSPHLNYHPRPYFPQTQPYVYYQRPVQVQLINHQFYPLFPNQRPINQIYQQVSRINQGCHMNQHQVDLCCPNPILIHSFPLQMNNQQFPQQIVSRPYIMYTTPVAWIDSARTMNHQCEYQHDHH